MNMIKGHLICEFKNCCASAWSVIAISALLCFMYGSIYEVMYLNGSLSTEKLEFYKEYFNYIWIPTYFLLLITAFTPIMKIRNKNGSLALMGWTGTAFLFSFVILVLTAFSRGSIPSGPSTAPYILAVSAFSMITIAIGWIIHVQSAMFNHRKTHTLNMLLQTRISTEYQNRHKALIKHYSFGNEISPQDVEAFYSEDPEFEESKVDAIRAAEYFLNFYDFLASGIKSNDLDEDLLYDSVRGYTSGLLEKTVHIRKHKTHEDSPKTWKPLKDLNARWKVRYATDPEGKVN